MNVKIQEANNSRIQTFTGVVIARKGAVSYTHLGFATPMELLCRMTRMALPTIS